MLLVGSVLTTFTNPIISAIADAMQAQKALMLISMGGQAACQLAMLAPSLGYRGLLILVTLHKLIGEHAFPIMDASTMATCGDAYGPIRLWGAIGFGAAAFGGTAPRSSTSTALMSPAMPAAAGVKFSMAKIVKVLTCMNSCSDSCSDSCLDSWPAHRSSCENYGFGEGFTGGLGAERCGAHRGGQAGW
jgi:hypothetical protein